jgi:release factor glutamine methyltransferase
MTLRDHVRAASVRLASAGIPDTEAALDAELLARDILGWDRAAYLVGAIDTPSQGFVEAFGRHIDRRAEREPVAYIRGRQEFWGRDFLVSPAVLVPRPETEGIVEEALGTQRGRAGLRVLDIGTGSGCLAITLALELGAPEPATSAHPGTQHSGTRHPVVVATDVSEDALAIARVNADRLLVAAASKRVEFRLGSGAAGATGPFELIVANPPYVAAAAYAALAPEVGAYEPRVALVGGADGLQEVRHTIRQAPALLAPGGRMLMEIGYDQSNAVEAIVADTEGLSLLRIRPDLGGIPRIAVIERADSLDRARSTGWE